MENNLSKALDVALSRLDKFHRRRIFREAKRYEIFDERINSFLQGIGTILFNKRDFDKFLYIPQATVKPGEGTIAVGYLEDALIETGRHSFDTDINDLPLAWEGDRRLSIREPDLQYEEFVRRGAEPGEWEICKRIVDEVFMETEQPVSIFIINLRFSYMTLVPSYKRSIFEGRLLITTNRILTRGMRETVVSRIQKEYRTLEEEVEGEEFEEGGIDF